VSGPAGGGTGSPSTGGGDASRRTHLASERTWLAWWRTGLAVSVAAIAIGRLAPEALHHRRTAYALVGVGYGLLAIAIFAASIIRYRHVQEALRRGDYDELDMRWVFGFGSAGIVLAIATLALIVF
jgi:putative membrane protein